jgi:hypothetical protein
MMDPVRRPSLGREFGQAGPTGQETLPARVRQGVEEREGDLKQRLEVIEVMLPDFLIGQGGRAYHASVLRIGCFVRRMDSRLGRAAYALLRRVHLEFPVKPEESVPGLAEGGQFGRQARRGIGLVA